MNNTHTTTTFKGTDDRTYVVDASGKVVDWYRDSDVWDDEGPYCSICDGLGHGFVGGPPCPLEDRGSWG